MTTPSKGPTGNHVAFVVASPAAAPVPSRAAGAGYRCPTSASACSVLHPVLRFSGSSSRAHAASRRRFAAESRSVVRQYALIPPPRTGAATDRQLCE